jgi:hypothetical protein
MTDEAAPNDGEPGEQADDQFVVWLAVNTEQAAELLGRGEFDFGDHPNISVDAEGAGRLALFLTRGQIDALRSEGYQAEVGANMSARARERVTEVGQGDRFEGGRITPRGLGRKIGGRGDDSDPDDRDRQGGQAS